MFLVTGTGFPVSPNPKPTVLLFSHTESDTETMSGFIRVLVLNVVPTQITAKLLIAQEKLNGRYSVQVLSGPHWSVADGDFLLK